MMVVLKVSVPSRGFGSDDRPVAARLPPPLLTWFPSPLGVLGLTTEDSISPGGQQISHVSVPSRGFGSDDRGGPGEAGGGFTRFRPLSGFWV
ncbi:Uncharacterised protein [Mycobacterium tuberculosis]|nr:Uncharacterised protein [Mycobacterium tuberculosis]